MGFRFNPPPGWPPVPEGFVPPPGWQPDPNWPPPPAGWQLWVKDHGTMNIRFLFPLPSSWALGHRTISCLIVDPTPDLTSSLLVANPRG